MNKIILTLVLSTAPSCFAFNYPGICEDAKLYRESSFFVRAPAAIGGCVGNIIGLPVGYIIGLPFGEPSDAAYFGGLLVNSGFNAATGAPFYVLESIPKKIYKSVKKDNLND